MNHTGDAALRLQEIDALQDDLLRQLDELERRSAAILAQCLAGVSRPEPPAGGDPSISIATCQARELKAA